MKSAYKEAFYSLVPSYSNLASSSFMVSNFFWKIGWSLVVPPEIRFFWWKICSNALATEETLGLGSVVDLPFALVAKWRLKAVTYAF